MIDIGELSPWCLHEAISYLPEDKIGLLAQSNKAFSRVCQSNPIWSSIYNKKFPPSAFVSSKNDTDIRWLDLYAARSSIPYNLKNQKPKVHSHLASDIRKITTLANSFAFDTDEVISLVHYDYNNTACEYTKPINYNVHHSDFLVMNDRQIATVDMDSITLIDIETKNQSAHIANSMVSPTICSVNNNYFAVVSEGHGFVYDIRDGCDLKCSFDYPFEVSSIISCDMMLYIAGRTMIQARDIRNPHGPTIWRREVSNPNSLCSFNVDAGYAFIGSSIVKLSNGALEMDINKPNLMCSAILSDSMAVYSEKDQNYVIFKNFITEKETPYVFTEENTICSIDYSNINKHVAIGGLSTVSILNPIDDDTGFHVDRVRNVLCGSVARRLQGDVQPLKQVVFDGERLITNMRSFVRVYDFYSGKTLGK